MIDAIATVRQTAPDNYEGDLVKIEVNARRALKKICPCGPRQEAEQEFRVVGVLIASLSPASRGKITWLRDSTAPVEMLLPVASLLRQPLSTIFSSQSQRALTDIRKRACG